MNLHFTQLIKQSFVSRDKYFSVNDSGGSLFSSVFKAYEKGFRYFEIASRN